MSGKATGKWTSCSTCGQRVAINPSGTLRLHRLEVLDHRKWVARRCNGSGQVAAGTVPA